VTTPRAVPGLMGCLYVVAKQKRDAEGLVEYARERVEGSMVTGVRSGVDLVLVEIEGVAGVPGR